MYYNFIYIVKFKDTKECQQCEYRLADSKVKLTLEKKIIKKNLGIAVTVKRKIANINCLTRNCIFIGIIREVENEEEVNFMILSMLNSEAVLKIFKKFLAEDILITLQSFDKSNIVATLDESNSCKLLKLYYKAAKLNRIKKDLQRRACSTCYNFYYYLAVKHLNCKAAVDSNRVRIEEEVIKRKLGNCCKILSNVNCRHASSDDNSDVIKTVINLRLTVNCYNVEDAVAAFNERMLEITSIFKKILNVNITKIKSALRNDLINLKYWNTNCKFDYKTVDSNVVQPAVDRCKDIGFYLIANYYSIPSNVDEEYDNSSFGPPIPYSEYGNKAFYRYFSSKATFIYQITCSNFARKNYDTKSLLNYRKQLLNLLNNEEAVDYRLIVLKHFFN